MTSWIYWQFCYTYKNYLLRLIAPKCLEVYLESYFFVLAKEFESIETSSGFAWQVSTLLTYSQIFSWNRNINLINYCHLTIFLCEIMNLLMILLKRDIKANEKSVNLQCVGTSMPIEIPVPFRVAWVRKKVLRKWTNQNKWTVKRRHASPLYCRAFGGIFFALVLFRFQDALRFVQCLLQISKKIISKPVKLSSETRLRTTKSLRFWNLHEKCFSQDTSD